MTKRTTVTQRENTIFIFSVPDVRTASEKEEKATWIKTNRIWSSGWFRISIELITSQLYKPLADSKTPSHLHDSQKNNNNYQ